MERVLTITHFSWYHVVLRYPPDRQAGTVRSLRDAAAQQGSSVATLKRQQEMAKRDTLCLLLASLKRAYFTIAIRQRPNLRSGTVYTTRELY